MRHTEQLIRFTAPTGLDDAQWADIDGYLRSFFYHYDAVDVVRETRIGDGRLTEYLYGYVMEAREDNTDIGIFLAGNPAHEDRYYSINGTPFHLDGITSETC